MSKIKQKTLLNLFGFGSRNTLNEWSKSDSRIILKLVNHYFLEEDLQEYLDTGKISKLEFNQEAHDVNFDVYDSISHYCNKLRNSPNKLEHDAYYHFGLFLESIEIQQINTRINLKYKEFVHIESELYSFYKNKFNKYLLDNNNKFTLEYMNVIDTNYNSLPTNAHKLYFLRNYMWTFMPSRHKKNSMDTEILLNNLPLIALKIPGVKYLVELGGEFGLAGIVNEKYFKKEK